MLLEGQLPMTEIRQPIESEGVRIIPRRGQIWILVRIGVAIVVVIGAVAIFRGFLGLHETKSVAQEPGTFKPTEEQAAGF